MAAITRNVVVSSSSITRPISRVGDELVGHLVQRHLGHVQAVREDQLQQQVERALEVGQPDLETLVGRRLGRHLPKRSMTSRASDRYACAPVDFGAQVVMGSPATLVSGSARCG